MDLNEIKVFVKVAQVGSFNQAAKQLSMPNSTVSAKVSSLEKRLGATLLQRTTRKLSLTQAGEAYFRRCQQALTEIDGAEAEVGSSQREPRGLLRVTAPVDLGVACLVDLVTKFHRQYAHVTVEMLFTDDIVDLVADGVDVAIRAGELKDSGLMAKKLGLAYWAPYASRGYLRGAGSPAHPKDLNRHTCLQFTPFTASGWELTRGKTAVQVNPPATLMANNVNLLKALCAAGNGIALLPSFTCRGEVENGALTRVLPEWRAFADPIHLVYPRQPFVAPKLRAFTEMAATHFKGLLSP